MFTISYTVTKDHRELEQYYYEVVNSREEDHQTRFGKIFSWELARHIVGEELVIYPALEKYLGQKGKELAENDRKGHYRVKKLLKEFQKMEASDANYVSWLKELWKTLSQHVEEEENDVLPALEHALKATDGQSEAIAKSFGQTKASVASRSHPSASKNPQSKTTSVGHLADPLRRFPDQKVSPNP